jgi:cytochrome c
MLKGGEAVLMSDPATYAAVTEGRIRPAGMTDDAFKAMVPPNKNDAEIAADTTFYIRRIPGVFPVTAEFLKRGQERFNIYCAPCHGESGYGDGMVAQHASDLMHTPDAVNGWTKPQNLNEDKIVKRPDGQIFNTITYGIRNMPAYDKQIAVEDRWAIIAYVRAVEHSQNAPPPAAP